MKLKTLQEAELGSVFIWDSPSFPTVYVEIKVSRDRNFVVYVEEKKGWKTKYKDYSGLEFNYNKREDLLDNLKLASPSIANLFKNAMLKS